MVSLTVGSGTSGIGSGFELKGGTTSDTSLAGGSIYISAGHGSSAAIDGAVQFAIAASAVITVTSMSVTVANTNTASVTATSVLTIDSTASTVTIDGFLGVDFATGYVSDFEVAAYASGVSDAVLVSGSAYAVTNNAQGGTIRSASTALAAGASETIVLTNSRVAATTNIVLTTVKTECTGAFVFVSGTTILAPGAVTIRVYNTGATACSSFYELFYFVV